MSTNTEIIGDPASCRASGEWIRGLAESALNSSVQLQQINTNSEYCWGDAVGDLFRTRIERGKRDSATFYDDIGRIGDAMVGFADDLERARASMDEARVIAVQGNVPITATTVEVPPRPAPADAGGYGEITVEEVREHEAIAERYRASVAAYEEALGIVRRARDEERDAHDTVRRKIEEKSGGILQTVASSPFMQIGQGLVQVGVGHTNSIFTQASTWSALANAQQGLADDARLAWHSGADQTARNAALSTFLQHQGQSNHLNATAARARNPPVLNALRTSEGGQGTLRFLTASPASQIAGEAYFPRVAQGLAGNLSPTGGIFAAVGVGTDLVAGESVEQAFASQGAAFIAGGATTGLLMASAAGGPAVFGAVLVGVGVSMLADMAVDEMFEQ